MGEARTAVVADAERRANIVAEIPGMDEAAVFITACITVFERIGVSEATTVAAYASEEVCVGTNPCNCICTKTENPIEPAVLPMET